MQEALLYLEQLCMQELALLQCQLASVPKDDRKQYEAAAQSLVAAKFRAEFEFCLIRDGVSRDSARLTRFYNDYANGFILLSALNLRWQAALSARAAAFALYLGSIALTVGLQDLQTRLLDHLENLKAELEKAKTHAVEKRAYLALDAALIATSELLAPATVLGKLLFIGAEYGGSYLAYGKLMEKADTEVTVEYFVVPGLVDVAEEILKEENRYKRHLKLLGRLLAVKALASIGDQVVEADNRVDSLRAAIKAAKEDADLFEKRLDQLAPHLELLAKGLRKLQDAFRSAITDVQRYDKEYRDKLRDIPPELKFN
jgi:hypothetical protein